jgi:hypothetical protein
MRVGAGRPCPAAQRGAQADARLGLNGALTRRAERRLGWIENSREVPSRSRARWALPCRSSGLSWDHVRADARRFDVSVNSRERR